jgi:hypothetical protein
MSATLLTPFDVRDPARLANIVNQLAQGRSNAGGRFTCGLSSATTTISDRNVGSDSKISICPATAAAGAELASGNLYIDTINAGSFVVHHANNATTGRTFMYTIQG